MAQQDGRRRLKRWAPPATHPEWKQTLGGARRSPSKSYHSKSGSERDLQQVRIHAESVVDHTRADFKPAEVSKPPTSH